MWAGVGEGRDGRGRNVRKRRSGGRWRCRIMIDGETLTFKRLKIGKHCENHPCPKVGLFGFFP